MLLVTLKDNKAETWSLPKWTHNKATALREFGQLVNDRSAATLVSGNAADFDLFAVGSAPDPFVGLVQAYDAPEHLANGIDVKVKE